MGREGEDFWEKTILFGKIANFSNYKVKLDGDQTVIFRLKVPLCISKNPWLSIFNKLFEESVVAPQKFRTEIDY